MRLKELRLSKKLSQNQLGKILNVTGQTILNWENELYEPSISKLIELADFFKVTLDYIVDRNHSISTSEIVCNELRKLNIDEIIEFVKSKISK